ncbi:ketoacyl-ACP synthase III [bacterium]|jgi:3-oxoacyl-[acyl-carrier-protein] synthase-3|nr:ketoacyl-ACP synthase III [bacterium]
MKYSRILGVGSFVPPKVVTNSDLAKVMDTSDDWVQQRTGIKQRHWVEGSVSTSDLALEACNHAIESAKIKKEEIDLIILATLSPDHEFPGTACFLQAKLGLPGVAALDIRQQCSGFIYGMSIADQFLKTGAAKKVLLVGSEVHSKGLDKTDRGRDVAVLFGDGAGAVVMGGFESPAALGLSDQTARVYSTHLHADGKFAKELWVQAPGMAYSNSRVEMDAIERTEHFPKMNGKVVFMNAVKRMPEAVMEALQANGLQISDVDLFLFHQANLRINEMVAQQLGIPAEKVFNTIDRFGNTTAATIPLGMDCAIQAGKLKPGMLVMSAAFGSGFTWGSALFRY